MREQFAAVSRKQYDQSVRLCRKPRYWMASSAAQADLLLENPFYEGVRETHLFDASEYQTEDYVQARQGVGAGPGPASTRVARGDGQERRHAIFWHVLYKRRP